MVTGACGVLETALWKKDVGRRLGFPGILAQGESNGGVLRKSLRRSPVEGRGGVSGGKVQAPISPGEGVGFLLGETIAVLAGSEVQVPSFFDFQ